MKLGQDYYVGSSSNMGLKSTKNIPKMDLRWTLTGPKLLVWGPYSELLCVPGAEKCKMTV